MDNQEKRTLSDADFMGYFASMRDATEMGFARIEDVLVAMESRLSGRIDGVEGRLTSVEGRLTSVEGRLTSVEGRLSGVERRIEALASETKTGFDQVNVRLARLERPRKR